MQIHHLARTQRRAATVRATAVDEEGEDGLVPVPAATGPAATPRAVERRHRHHPEGRVRAQPLAHGLSPALQEAVDERLRHRAKALQLHQRGLPAQQQAGVGFVVQHLGGRPVVRPEAAGGIEAQGLQRALARAAGQRGRQQQRTAEGRSGDKLGPRDRHHEILRQIVGQRRGSQPVLAGIDQHLQPVPVALLQPGSTGHRRREQARLGQIRQHQQAAAPGAEHLLHRVRDIGIDRVRAAQRAVRMAQRDLQRLARRLRRDRRPPGHRLPLAGAGREVAPRQRGGHPTACLGGLGHHGLHGHAGLARSQLGGEEVQIGAGGGQHHFGAGHGVGAAELQQRAPQAGRLGGMACGPLVQPDAQRSDRLEGGPGDHRCRRGAERHQSGIRVRRAAIGIGPRAAQRDAGIAPLGEGLCSGHVHATSPSGG